MLGEIFGGKIAKDFIKGIKSIATTQNVEYTNVQIRLTFSGIEDSPIKYEKCLNWQPNGEVTYRRIMNINMDLLGQEAMVTPVILQSMVKQCQQLEIDAEKFSVFLFAKDEQIGVAIFDGGENKRVCPISKLFE
jgi:hypothetical protein